MKKVWSILSIFALGIVVFNNFDQSLSSIVNNGYKITALFLAFLITLIYHQKNTK